MNADQFKGKWMQFKGELKKQYGKFTDDDLKQIEGNHDKFVGKVQERYGDKKDELMKWADQWHQMSSAGRHEGKDVLTGSHRRERWLTEEFHISVKRKIMKTRYCGHTLHRSGCRRRRLSLCRPPPLTYPKRKRWSTTRGSRRKPRSPSQPMPGSKGDRSKSRRQQGGVMLRGKVDSDEAKRAAEGITAGLDGVKTVKNELQIVAPSTREAVEEKDEAITVRVKEHFAKDAHLKNAAIDVQTNAGVVSLTGEVRDIMTSAQASWTARQVPGVKSVKNDLTVKEKA